jgi:hypothetical protein
MRDLGGSPTPGLPRSNSGLRSGFHATDGDAVIFRHHNTLEDCVSGEAFLAIKEKESQQDVAGLVGCYRSWGFRIYW